MDVLSRMAAAGIVPVVVLDRAEDAVPTARAMLAGGIDVMEITFRTAAAADSIRAVASLSRPATMRRPWPGAWKTASPSRPAV